MRFLRPDFLFFLWLVPLLLGFYLLGWRRTQRIMRTFAGVYADQMILPHGRGKSFLIRLVLMLLAVCFLVMALAGPLIGYRWQRVESRGIDLMVAVDCSRSMLVEDGGSSRLERVKRGIVDLLADLGGDRLGLVAFAGTAFVQCPLTPDLSAISLFIRNMSSVHMPVGGTNLDQAIEVSLNGLAGNSGDGSAILILSDGGETVGNALRFAGRARKMGIKIHAAVIGSRQNVPLPDGNGGYRKDQNGRIIMVKADDQILRKIADITGGTFVNFGTGEADIRSIYSSIRGDAESELTSSGRRKKYVDRYQWFLMLAVICLMTEMILPRGGVRPRRSVNFPLILLCCLVLWPGVAFATSTSVERELHALLDRQLRDPDNSEIYYNMGNVYFRMGKYGDAVRNYREALEKGPSSLKARAAYNLGSSSYRMGALADASHYYELAVELAPHDDDAKRNLIFVRNVYEKFKKIKHKDKKKQKHEDKSPEEKKTNIDRSLSTVSPDIEDRLLNRLNDRPGGAMTPNYEKREVKKDW